MFNSVPPAKTAAVLYVSRRASLDIYFLVVVKISLTPRVFATLWGLPEGLLSTLCTASVYSRGMSG